MSILRRSRPGGHRERVALGAAVVLACASGAATAQDDAMPPLMPDIAKLLASYRTADLASDAVAPGDWPFVADAGTLTCVRYMNQDWAFFEPDGAGEDADGFPIVTDPGALFASGLGQPGVLKPFPGFPELIRQMSATRDIALALCADGKGFLDGVTDDPNMVPAPQQQ